MRQLLLWSLGALVVVWGCFVFLAYRTGIEEADELTDGHLASVAVLLLGIQDLPSLRQVPEVLRLRQERLKNHDYQQSFSVLVWDAQGKLRWRSGAAPVIVFDPGEGYATLLAGDEQQAWRTFSQWNQEHTQKIAVMLLLEKRDALAQDIAGQMMEPGLWLLPVVALALGLAISRGLQPLVELSEEVAALDVQSANSLVARHPVREFDSVVASINTLLERQQQALLRERRLASEIAHELRTPLNGIIGFSEFLIDEKPGKLNDKQKEYVNDVLNSGRHLLQLINDVLDLAKVEAGKMELFLEEFSLGKVISEVSSVVRPIVKKKNLTLDIDMHPGIDIVRLDQQKLKQVLYNLLSNSVKFTNDGGKIRVRAMPQDTVNLQLQVIDTGIGIRKEDIGKLFVEFQQIDAGADRRFQGTGLGLALTKRIAELFKGCIEVQSVPGVGSTFTVTLPRRFGEEA